MARILIIKLGALGDIVIASPVIARLVEHHRQDQVDLLTSSPFAALYADSGVLNVNSPDSGRWRAVFSAGLDLRRKAYDRVYDLQGNKRSRLLAWLSGAPARAGLWPGWPYDCAPAIDRSTKMHPLARLDAVLAALDIIPATSTRPLIVDPEPERVDDWLEKHSLTDRPLVLMHAGGSPRWRSKRWSEDAFRTLAQALTARGFAVIWLGGPADKAVNSRLATVVGVDASGVFSIPALMTLAKRARFAITNDSAPMHVLAAGQLPVYGLFGPTDWRISHAAGQYSRVLKADLPCSPCFRPRCPLPGQAHHCMKSITPEHVFDRVDGELLIVHRKL